MNRLSSPRRPGNPNPRRTDHSSRVALSAAIETLELRRLLSASYELSETYVHEPLRETFQTYGTALASKGNLLLVGAPSRYSNEGAQESAWLINTATGDKWEFRKPSAHLEGDFFGASVAFVGNDKIAVSSPQTRAEGHGVVYLYDGITADGVEGVDAGSVITTPAKTLDSPYNNFGNSFGGLVSVGDDLFVGASTLPNTDESVVLRYDTTGDNLADDFYFIGTRGAPFSPIGPSLSTKGNLVLAAGVSDGLPSVFAINGATDAVTVVAQDTDNADPYYGLALASTSDSIIVSSPLTGRVFEYFDDGSATRVYGAPAESSIGLFGTSLAVNQAAGTLLITDRDGTSGLDQTETQDMSGVAYVYALSDGAQLATLHSPTPSHGDDFGESSAALPGGKFAIGDPRDDDANGEDLGAVYVFAPEVVEPTNLPPTADAGADVSADENASVVLDAGGSTDPDGAADIVAYAWDLDNNGSYETSGQSVTISTDVAGSKTVGLQVTDSAGNQSTDDVLVTFTNVAPTANAGADQSAVVGQQVTFAGSGASSSDAIVAYAWDLDDDGQFDDATTATATAIFTTAGAHTVRLRVTDDDGETAVDTATVNVAQSGLVDGTLYVGGTAGNDAVTIGKNAAGGVTLTVGSTTTTYDANAVVVYGGAGDDTIQVGGSVGVVVEIHGGDGNDTIKGGNGGNILLGDAGNDVISGGNSRDVIIGGTGADSLSGLPQDDVLVAGHATTNVAAVYTVWTSSDSYAARVALLATTLLRTDIDVFDDAAIDTLSGQSGQDYFVFNSDGLIRDVLSDLKKDELVADVDVVVV